MARETEIATCRMAMARETEIGSKKERKKEPPLVTRLIKSHFDHEETP